MLKKISKILARILLSLLLILITIWVALHFSPVQTWLVKKVAGRLSKELRTEVEVGHVDFSFFHQILLEDVLIRDRQKDTLAYAGSVEAKLNDWFFLKDEIIVYKLDLKKINLYAHRSDSIWNYQFLLDYFQKPPASKPSKPIQIQLKEIRVQSCRILQKDEWTGTDMAGSIGYLGIKSKQINLSDQLAELEEVTLEQPLFSIRDYTGKKTASVPLSETEYHRKNDTLSYVPSGWNISVQKMSINRGQFISKIEVDRPIYNHFDESNIRFYNIQGNFKTVRFRGDSLTARTELAAKERCGFEVKKLKANLIWHPEGMEFHELSIQTPYSRLGSYFAMRYRRFNHDMNRFLNHVRLEGDFDKSDIHTNDIAYFAPELKNWNLPFKISGSAKGTLEHLNARNLELLTAESSQFEGDLQIDSLFDIDAMRIQLTGKKLITTYEDVARFYPAVRRLTNPNIASIQQVQWKGNFSGKLNDFHTNGVFETTIGKITTNLHLQFPSKKAPLYEGTIAADQFNLRSFLGIQELGKLSMHAKLNGKGYELKDIQTGIDAKIQLIEYNDYPYSNLSIQTQIKNKRIEGQITIADPNVKGALKGEIITSTDRNHYKLDGEISQLNFKKIKLWDKDIDLSGKIESAFDMKNLNDISGMIRLWDASFLAEGEKLSFDFLGLSQQTISDSVRLLEIQTNEFEANLKGQYNLVRLPALIQQLIANYFPSYINPPKEKPGSQAFSFEIFARNISPFLNLFSLPLSGFNQSSLTGSIDVSQNKFNTSIHVPAFAYQQIDFKDLYIESNSNIDQLALNGQIGNILISDNLSMPSTQFTFRAANDTGFISLNTRASQTLNDASLQSRFRATASGFIFNFLPSTLVLNDKTWTLSDASDLQISKNNLFSDGIKLVSGNEELFLYTHPSETGNYNDLSIELKKVEAGEMLPLLFTDPRIEGSVSGKIDVINPLGKYMIEATLNAERFRFNNDSIGRLPIEANFNSSNGDINYRIESENLGYLFTIKGKTNISDPARLFTDNIVEINQTPLRLLEPYLAGILSQIKGTGTGILRVKGDALKPDLIGEVRLQGASLVVDYTKCRYLIRDGSPVQFEEGKLLFNQLQVTDTTGKKAIFRGDLKHQFFNQMQFNLSFQSEDNNKGILVLNTTKKDNSLFYGKVIAKANGSITGPLSNIQIKLKGEPTDSSRIYLTTSDSRVTGTANFIVFKQYGTEQKAVGKLSDISQVTVDLDMTVNPFAKAYIILDEITNDIIEGQGRGSINLRVGTNERTTMTGNFSITSGRYNFNWQSLFKRPFIISGGTINWNGDPYDARINIDANYLVEKVSLPAIYASGCSNERSDLMVVANLSNTLKNPEIKFRFELPQGHPCKNNPLTNTSLNQLYSNTDELNRQVISLLLVGSFVTGTNTGALGNAGIGSTFFSNAAGTLSEFVAQQVTSGLGAVIKNIPALKDLKLDPYVTFTPGLISGTQAQGLGFQGTGSFGFTSRMLNGRMLLKAGGSVLVAAGQSSTVQNNNQLTPDLSLEWLVSPDGKLRLIGFYRTVYDIQRRNDRTGVSFSYVKEFDKW